MFWGETALSLFCCGLFDCQQMVTKSTLAHKPVRQQLFSGNYKLCGGHWAVYGVRQTSFKPGNLVIIAVLSTNTCCSFYGHQATEQERLREWLCKVFQCPINLLSVWYATVLDKWEQGEAFLKHIFSQAPRGIPKRCVLEQMAVVGTSKHWREKRTSVSRDASGLSKKWAGSLSGLALVPIKMGVCSDI